MHQSRLNTLVKVGADEYLLFNQVTGNLALVDKEVVDFLEIPDNEGNPVSFLLKEKGFLIEDDIVEDADYLCSVPKEKGESLLRHIIVVTYQCNLRCSYCYQDDVLSTHPAGWETRVLTRHLVDDLYDAILSAENILSHTGSHIVLYGGEPFLFQNREIVEYILKKGKDLGYTFRAITNGTQVEAFVDMFREYDVHSLSITLDGPKDIHDSRRSKANGKGTFDDIIANIEILLKNDIHTRIRTNIDEQNLKHLPQLLRFFEEREWDDNPYIDLLFAFTRQRNQKEVQNIPQSFSEFLALLERMDVGKDPWLRDVILDLLSGTTLAKAILGRSQPSKSTSWQCPAVGHDLAYDPYGNIYVCQQVLGNEVHSVGRYSPTFELTKNFGQWQDRTLVNLPRCLECEYASLCGGGCPISAFNTSGTIMEPSQSQCKSVEAYVHEVIPQLYRMVKRGFFHE
ncbi:MAG: radical SAM protein [Theionarchaea archaeon]|nr:radical SAM protein [Theionarchaea archaeon]MBU7036732.1 radical SAM protein [Theionarchaea archaeon]